MFFDVSNRMKVEYNVTYYSVVKYKALMRRHTLTDEAATFVTTLSHKHNTVNPVEYLTKLCSWELQGTSQTLLIYRQVTGMLLTNYKQLILQWFGNSGLLTRLMYNRAGLISSRCLCKDGKQKVFIPLAIKVIRIWTSWM